MTPALRFAALLLGLAASAAAAAPRDLSPAAAADPAAGARGLRVAFEEGQALELQGRRLVYSQREESLLAEGEVVLESAGTVVHADRLWYDLKSGMLRAEGGVVMADPAGNTLWAQRVALDQLSRTGEARQLLYGQGPWSAACGSAQLLPGDVVLLKGCECTSCTQERPLWRLSARTLKLKANERLWAWGVWLYAGRVPVFYLPYYTQSLKDPRPPVEIKPGYSRSLGSYLRLGYNYYLGEGQYGSLRYDWMERRGNGWGLGQHYRLGSGEGELAAYYSVDKNDPSQRDWSARLSHEQDLGAGLRLLANGELLSRPAFNQLFDSNQVDAYQRRSYLSLQSSQKSYAWNLQASETQVLQSLPDGSGGVLSQQMVPAERLLPAFSFSRFSLPLAEGSPLYWGLEAQARRRLLTPRVLLSSTAATVFDTARSQVFDELNLSPGLSYTLPLASRLALSSSLNLSTGWQREEGVPGRGDLQAGYGSFVNLQARLRPGSSLNLGHRYQRQVLPGAGLPWAGESLDQLESSLRARLGPDLSLLLLETYDLRPWRSGSDLERLGLLRAEAAWSPDADRSASLTAGWHAPTGAFKTVDASLSANHPRQLWQLNLGGNWVNNAIAPRASALDPLAPAGLDWAAARQPDQLLASLRASLALGPKWRLNAYGRLDLVRGRAEEEAASLYHDFGCIDAELFARETSAQGWQFGFALSLRSVPGARVNSSQITADLFDKVQYGY